MALTSKQKAAMLLMSLDVATATEMLKGLDQKVIQELAVELAYLNTAGFSSSKQSTDIAKQFYNSLQNGQTFHLKSFLKEMLKSTVGEDKAEQIQTQIQDLLLQRDPFIAIRSADLHTLALTLENEHPQAVAVVLSELPPKASSEILGLLGEGMRLSVISRMINIESVTAEAKARIAEMISKSFESVAAHKRGPGVQAGPEQSLRKVAVILRNLGKELRDGLLGAIQEKDSSMGQQVTDLMIVWEDILQVADRSLQEALRGIDERGLALALHKTDEAIIQKIKSNISERAAALIDEETSLMSAPKKEDIKEAREKIISKLREMNSKGELAFEEE
jgi:flagellar motor switch protein FliG